MGTLGIAIVGKNSRLQVFDKIEEPCHPPHPSKEQRSGFRKT